MSKTYYCWRCKIPIPMLSDEEWERVHPFIGFDIERTNTYKIATGSSFKEAVSAVHDRAFELYYNITGFRETNINALAHHQLSQYGDECPACGHLLRTPKASFCANCGKIKD